MNVVHGTSAMNSTPDSIPYTPDLASDYRDTGQKTRPWDGLVQP